MYRNFASAMLSVFFKSQPKSEMTSVNCCRLILLTVFCFAASFISCSAENHSKEGKQVAAKDELSYPRYIESFPAISGAFDRTQAEFGDKFIAQGNFDAALKYYEYSLNNYKWSPAQQSAIMAREAWALCLARKFDQAKEKIKQALVQLPTSDHRVYSPGLHQLLCRIYLESGDDTVLDSYYRNFPNQEWVVKSYLACLLLQKKSSRYRMVHDAFALVSPGTLEKCKCAVHADEIFAGLTCKNSQKDLLESWRKLFSAANLPNASFEPEKWKAAYKANSNYRLRALPELLSSNKLFGIEPRAVRDLLGPPSFVSPSFFYQDYFPLCVQHLGKVSSLGNVQQAEQNDSLWFLVITYGDEHKVARVDFQKLPNMFLQKT